MNHKVRLAIVIVVTLWASAFVGIKIGLQTFSPEGLALSRYLVASVVMGIIYFFSPRTTGINVRDKLGLLLTGVIGIGVYNLTLNYGEMSVSSGMAGFLASQTPVLTTLFAVMFLGEELTAFRVFGFAVSIFGVVLIAVGETKSASYNIGILYLLCALLAGSLYSILQKPYMNKYTTLEATTHVIWGGTLFLMIYVSHLHADILHASILTALDVIYLGVFPAALAYAVWGYVLSQIPVSRAVSFVYAMPFVAALLGWLFLGEIPARLSVVGALLAISGVWLISQSYRPVKVIGNNACDTCS